MHRLKKIFFVLFCTYKMVKINTKTWNNSRVYVTIIHCRGENKPVLWLRIKDIGRESDVKNILDLLDKEIKGKLNTNNPKKQ